MSDIEIGQVLTLKIRFNNSGVVSKIKHPVLVVDIDYDLDIIEVAQIDSLEDKEYKAAFRSNKTIYCDNETVIDKASFIQMDNSLKIENFPELSKYRRQPDKLSPEKLNDVLKCYRKYHANNEINEDKQVYMDKFEFFSLN